MRKQYLAATLMFATLLTAGAFAADAPATATAKIGATAPGFTLTNEQGKPVSLAEFAGKTVVLAWFNADCPFVQRHLKANTFNDLASKYKDKDVVVLAIDSSHTHTIADDQKAVQESHLTFPVLNDASGTVGHTYNAKTTPDMFVIDKTGTIVYEGAIDNDPSGDSTSKINYVSKALDEVLAGKNVTTAETKSYGCSVKFAQ